MKTPLANLYRSLGLSCVLLSTGLAQADDQVILAEDIPQAQPVGPERRARIESRKQALVLAREAAVRGDLDECERVLVEAASMLRDARERSLEEFSLLFSLTHRLIETSEPAVAYEIAQQLLARLEALESILVGRDDGPVLARVRMIEGDLRERLLTDRDGALRAYEEAERFAPDPTAVRLRIERIRREQAAIENSVY